MGTTSGIITLTSDFGLQDGYVAAMKGVLLGIAPDANLVDVTHLIQPQDIMEAAYVLRNAAATFPDGTVHLAVVDPGVGTSRDPVAVRHGGHYYVGPDNGLFSLVLSKSDPEIVVRLDRTEFWRSDSPSTTFHGRDIFAPVAGHLATGTPIEELGSKLTSMTTMHWALPISDDQGIQGWVVHVDRFGNCVTNITRELFEEQSRERPFKCYSGNAIIEAFNESYADAPPGDATLLFNSNDMLEIAIYRDNAGSLLDIRKGAPVNILFSEDRS